MWPPKRSEFAVRLGEQIKAGRVRKGLSQGALAAELHVTQTVVSQWERGVGQPSAHHLVFLVHRLGISLAQLVELAELAVAS